MRRAIEPAAYDGHGMGIHRIDVEKVMLHLPNDLAELWNVATQDSIAAHSREFAYLLAIALVIDPSGTHADRQLGLVRDQLLRSAQPRPALHGDHPGLPGPVPTAAARDHSASGI